MCHFSLTVGSIRRRGLAVERDFVECPSQMLENWCWDLEGLRRMSQHHATGEPLPHDLADLLIASRLANVGQFNLRQITLAMFDLELHIKPQAETAGLFRKIQEQLLGYKPQDGTNFSANFGHLMGGYDAQYYGYLEIYSHCKSRGANPLMRVVTALAALRLARTKASPSVLVTGAFRAGARLAQTKVALPQPSVASSRHLCQSPLAVTVARSRDQPPPFDMDTENGTAPGVLRAWDFNVTPQELHTRATRIMDEGRKIFDKIGALQGDEITFDSVLKEIAEAQRMLTNESSYLELPMYVSTKKELRDTSAELSTKLNEFEVEIEMRPDIFEKLLALEKKDTSSLTPEMKRYLERLIKLRKRDGLHLDAEVQKEVKKLKNEINDLGVQYTKHFNEENTVLEFTEEELKGTPEDFIKSLETSCGPSQVESGKRKVTLKHPHVMPIMKMAADPETRRKVNFACEARCIKENIPLLEKAISLRHKKSQILNYPTHADFVTELLMARSAANVRRFLTDLAEKLQPLWAKEKKVLLELKEEECKRQGVPFDGELHVWDMAFYKNLVEERHYKVDQEKLRAYFPLDVVMKGLFGIYE
ncbi:hypothetical protein V5799_027109, partial [Amblyomma americanum]